MRPSPEYWRDRAGEYALTEAMTVAEAKREMLAIETPYEQLAVHVEPTAKRKAQISPRETTTRLLQSFHRSRLSQLHLCLAEAQRHILHSREMIVDTQHSILMLDGMLRELSMTRRERHKSVFSATPENIICPLIMPVEL